MKSEPPAHPHSSDSALRLVDGVAIERLRFIPIRHAPSPRNYAREQEIIASYQSGETLHQIGQSHGICLQRVHQILTRAGVELRPTGPTPARRAAA